MAYATKEKEVAYQRWYRRTHRARLKEQAHQRYLAQRTERLAKQRQYHLAHRPEALMRMRAHRLAHKDDVKAASQAYYEAHKPVIKAKVKAYQQRHPDRDHSKHARRRAHLANNGKHDLTAAQWRETKAAYGYRCVYCGKKTIALTQDHLTPISAGGAHTFTNVVPACSSCNSRKHTGAPLCPVQPLLLTVAPSKPYQPRKSNV